MAYSLCWYRFSLSLIHIFIEVEQQLKTQELTIELLKLAKRLEFPDRVIAKYTGKSEKEIHEMRKTQHITAAYKTVDTCAAEFDASTPYYYSVHGGYNEVNPQNDKKKIMVLGSGPIRIGQGIEFDYCSVHCAVSYTHLDVYKRQKLNYKTFMDFRYDLLYHRRDEYEYQAPTESTCDSLEKEIKDTMEMLRNVDINDAVKDIVQAKSVLICSSGMNKYVAKILAVKLSLYGIRTIYPDDHWFLYLEANNLTAEDFVLSLIHI